MNHSDDVAKAIELLKRTLPELNKRNIASTPNNYAIWYEYVTGENKQLVNAVQELDKANTIYNTEILQAFREGKFDVLIGVNLLREGLDLPEVTLVAILDADREGFLRSQTSLMQTVGRAARNVKGKIILYADKKTESMKRAINEAERRRKKQLKYNKEHNITPINIYKKIEGFLDVAEE